jgi:hypothetical protein
MPGIITGRQAQLQIGEQTDWSTAVTPGVAIDFESETLEYMPMYIESPALLGLATTSRMDVAGVKTEGGWTQIVNPDNIGLLLGATFGAEASAALTQAGSAAYDHVFSPISAGVSATLPKLTVRVNRIVKVMGYIGTKIDNMTLTAASQDYLKAEFSCRGYDEDEGQSIGTGSISTKRPFQFIDGTIQVDDTTYAEVTNFSMSYANNLENDLFTMDGTDKMREIEPQGREITFSIDVLYSSTTEETRSTKFKTGSVADLKATFESTELVSAGDFPYRLHLHAPNCYITSASPNVGGPDRITKTLELKATQQFGSEAVTASLRDGQDTKYLS